MTDNEIKAAAQELARRERVVLALASIDAELERVDNSSDGAAVLRVRMIVQQNRATGKGSVSVDLTPNAAELARIKTIIERKPQE